jgi:hypothetical protein
MTCFGSTAVWKRYQLPLQWMVGMFCLLLAVLIAIGIYRNNQQLSHAHALSERLQLAHDQALQAHAAKHDFLAFLVLICALASNCLSIRSHVTSAVVCGCADA